MKLELIC